MEEMRKRFDEIIKYDRENKSFPCMDCPCYTECKNLPEEDYSCEDMYFAYIAIGKNFDLKKEKIIKRG
jgi:hypothetical protein